MNEITGFECPFCNASIPNLYATYKTTTCYFNANCAHIDNDEPKNTNIIDIDMLYCPKCNNVSFKAIGKNRLEGLQLPIYPISNCKKYPNYVPKFIIEDYQEAYSILNLSPKASATLSRRCLQGMIRDFWGISKSRLVDEIDELKSRVSSSQWKAINSLRSIGNIGAHMEKDVNTIIDIDPNEAEKLLKLIELLIDKWYIARHDEEELLNDIVDIDTSKKSKK